MSPGERGRFGSGVVTGLVAGLVLAALVAALTGVLDRDDDGDATREAVETVEDNYFEEVDARTL